MEKKEKSQLQKTIAQELLSGGIKELVIREGKAAEIVPEIKEVDVNLFGTITAPYEFYSKRPKQFEESRAHIK